MATTNIVGVTTTGFVAFRRMGAIGSLIKSKRLQLGWTQGELAKRAHVSQQLIAKLESGAARESRKLPQIAAAFGLGVDEFLEGSLRSPRAVRESVTWPFDIAYSRFASLTDREKTKVEGVVEAAIREYESRRVDTCKKNNGRN